jgi:hypothetical protein
MMGKPFQIIETPGGERLVVIPEAEYLQLVRGSGGPVGDPDDGELDPAFVDELRTTLNQLNTGSAEPIPFGTVRRRRR